MSCLNFRACSLVLLPHLGGRYGGRYGAKGGLFDSESEESQEMLILSLLSDIVLILEKLEGIDYVLWCFWMCLGFTWKINWI